MTASDARPPAFGTYRRRRRPGPGGGVRLPAPRRPARPRPVRGTPLLYAVLLDYARQDGHCFPGRTACGPTSAAATTSSPAPSASSRPAAWSPGAGGAWARPPSTPCSRCPPPRPRRRPEAPCPHARPAALRAECPAPLGDVAEASPAAGGPSGPRSGRRGPPPLRTGPRAPVTARAAPRGPQPDQKKTRGPRRRRPTPATHRRRCPGDACRRRGRRGVVALLVEQGVTRGVAEALAARHPAEVVRRQVECHRHRVTASGLSRNPAGALVRAIREAVAGARRPGGRPRTRAAAWPGRRRRSAGAQEEEAARRREWAPEAPGGADRRAPAVLGPGPAGEAPRAHRGGDRGAQAGGAAGRAAPPPAAYPEGKERDVRWRPPRPPRRPPRPRGATRRRRRFTVDEYHRMAEAGILGEDERVELLDGDVVEMSPVGDPHVEAVNRCERALRPGLGRRAADPAAPRTPSGSTATTSRSRTSRSPRRRWWARPGWGRSCWRSRWRTRRRTDDRARQGAAVRPGGRPGDVAAQRGGAARWRSTGSRGRTATPGRTPWRPEQQVACEAFSNT